MLLDGRQAKDQRLWCLRAAIRFKRDRKESGGLDLLLQSRIKDPFVPEGGIFKPLWRTPDETRVEGDEKRGLRAFLARALLNH